MRKLTILLLLLTVVSFADVLFSQSYDNTIDTAISYHGIIHQADNFTVSSSGRLEKIEWWSFFRHGVNTVDVRLHEDDAGVPGTVVWELLGVTPTLADTNITDFYLAEIVVDATDYYTIDAGTTYWISLNHDGSGAYWGMWTTQGCTAAASNNSGASWQLMERRIYMFRLSGTSDSAVEEATWGQLKAAPSFTD